MNTNKIIPFFIFMFIATCVSGETVLTLPEILTRSLQKNYSIKIIKNSEKSIRRGNTWGEAGRHPVISMSATYSDNWLKSGSDPTALTRDVTSSIDLNWTLFDGFRILIRKEQFDLMDRQAEVETARVIEKTIKDILIQYYALLLEQEKLLVNRKLTTLARDTHQRELDKKKFGSSSEFQILEAKKSMLGFRNRELKQQTALNNARRNLLFLMGEAGREDYKFEGIFKALPREYQPDKLLKETIINNRTINSMNLGNKILRENRDLADCSWFPTINLSGGIKKTHPLKHTNQPMPPVKNRNYYLNLGVNFKIFDGGRRKVASAKARLAEKAGKLRLAELKLSIQNQLRTFIDNYQISKEGLRLAEEELKAAALSLTLSKEKYRTGSINSFQYRDVQLKYLQASNRKLEAVFSMITAEVEIMHIAGKLSSSVNIVSSAQQAKDNRRDVVKTPGKDALK